MADSVTCAYPLSGMYNTTTRYTYYVGILILLIGPAKPWFAVAPATNAAIYSSTTALHSLLMASQPRSRSAPFDVDAVYAILINVLGIGPALYISLLPKTLVRGWIRVLAINWSICLVIGMVSASIAVSRPPPVFEPCIGTNSGAILVQPRDLDLDNFTCAYPCFEPSLASNLRSAMDVKAISSLPLSSHSGDDEGMGIFTRVPLSLSVLLYVSSLFSLVMLYTDLTHATKSTWGLVLASVPLALTSVSCMLVFELELQVRNLPQDESFKNVGQWSVLVNTLMVVLGAIYTGWKPRIRVPGTSHAPDWHYVDPLEEAKLRGFMLSDMAPDAPAAAAAANRGTMRMSQNDVEPPPPTEGFPGERLSRHVHKEGCSFEQTRHLDLEASRMMPYLDYLPPGVFRSTPLEELLKESGFL
ncbi:hypothetical protein RBB50_010353 [Rhinocladiella similis]